MCVKEYQLEHGHVDFSGRLTLYGEIVPVFCDEGYETNGDPFITCLAEATWSSNTYCRPRGTHFLHMYLSKITYFLKGIKTLSGAVNVCFMLAFGKGIYIKRE